MIAPLPAGIEIHWLEPVEHLDYVRMSVMFAGTRRRGMANQFKHHAGRPVGWELLPPDTPSDDGHGYFSRRVFWVKDYDRGQPGGATGPYRSGGAPTEAVDPKRVG